MKPTINIENVRKNFNDQEVIKNVSLTISVGERVMLLGKSGSGKTTLLKLINKLHALDQGKIEIDGINIHHITEEKLRRAQGYVIQKIGLLPHLSVFQNLALPRKITGSKLLKDEASSLMQMMTLDPQLLDRLPSELSGGQQQRVGLARALVLDPKIILMDEPFSALDPITRIQLQNDLVTLPIFRDKAIIMVTHDLEESMRVGTKIAMLDKGVLQQVGSPLEILTKPANDFVKDFIGNQRFPLMLQNISPQEIGIASQEESLMEILGDDGASPSLKSEVLEKVAAL